MGDDSEWMKLPTDQKCEHKVYSCIFHLHAFYSSFQFISTQLKNNNISPKSNKDRDVEVVKYLCFYSYDKSVCVMDICEYICPIEENKFVSSGQVM